MKSTLTVLTMSLLGLSLVACYESSCTGIGPEEMGALVVQQVTPQWSGDGAHIAFSLPPTGLFVVDLDSLDVRILPSGAPIGTLVSPGSFSPSLSPDGSRVAYAMAVRELDTTDIVTSAIDGSDLRRLTKDNAVDAHPAWSPDGRQIAFMSTRKSSYPAMHLYVMSAIGSHVRSLAPSTKTRGHPPVWSPDGEHIAFVAYVRSEDMEEYDFLHVVRTVSSDGSNQTEFGETISNPAWSPDGGRIAFMKTDGETRGLYVVGADGSDPRTLISFDGQSLWYDTLSWSPDGREILYGRGGYFTLVAIDEDSEKATVVTRFHEIAKPGGTIVVVDEASGESVTVAAEFPTPRGDSKNPKVATVPTTSRSGPGGAAWSPDGSRIAFHVHPSGGSGVVLYTTASDGSDWRVLVRGKRVVIED